MNGQAFAMRDRLSASGGYRLFLRGDSMARAWNAVITDGSLTGAAGSVWRFLRFSSPKIS